MRQQQRYKYKSCIRAEVQRLGRRHAKGTRHRIFLTDPDSRPQEHIFTSGTATARYLKDVLL